MAITQSLSPSPCPIQTFAGEGALKQAKPRGGSTGFTFWPPTSLAALRLHFAQPTLLQQETASDSMVSMCCK